MLEDSTIGGHLIVVDMSFGQGLITNCFVFLNSTLFLNLSVFDLVKYGIVGF